MIASYKRKANIATVVWIAGLIGLTALSLIRGKDPMDDAPLGPMIVGIYVVAFFLSFWWYIKAKGRSGGWIFMFAFNVIGMLVILLLKDHAKDGQPPAPHAPQEYFS